jgi:hypothetical protein
MLLIVERRYFKADYCIQQRNRIRMLKDQSESVIKNDDESVGTTQRKVALCFSGGIRSEYFQIVRDNIRGIVFGHFQQVLMLVAIKLQKDSQHGNCNFWSRYGFR